MFYRKLLLWIHGFEFVLFFSLSIFTFALPSIKSALEKKGESFDLFYKIIFVGITNYVSDNYTTFGAYLLIISFIYLICFFGIHGMFKFGIYVSTIFSFLLIVFFPIGTILSPFSLYIIFNLHKDFEETEKKVRHLKLSKISIEKLRPKIKFIHEIKKENNALENSKKVNSSTNNTPSKSVFNLESKLERKTTRVIKKLNTNLSKKKSS